MNWEERFAQQIRSLKDEWFHHYNSERMHMLLNGLFELLQEYDEERSHK